MSENVNEQQTGSAEQVPEQPAVPVHPETPESPAPAGGDPLTTTDVESSKPADEQPADEQPADEQPTSDEQAAAAEDFEPEPHPYVPGFGVTGKFDTPGAQDAGDDDPEDRA